MRQTASTTNSSFAGTASFYRTVSIERTLAHGCSGLARRVMRADMPHGVAMYEPLSGELARLTEKESKMENLNTDRTAYAGELILTAERSASMDSWQTGLNNNVLVLGSSGSGKTRNFLKPNLLQCVGSYVVLDSKGQLYRELGPYLRERGYKVDRLDFTTMEGTVGYDPLRHVRWRGGRPLGQDIIAIASSLFPREDMGQDPFWSSAAANYLASYIAYVFEAYPAWEQNMASVVSVFERACDGDSPAMFARLERQDPDSYAAALFRRARTTAHAEKMHASIMGIIAANIFPLTFDGALASFRRSEQIDFCALGHERRALFVTMDDMDKSLAPLTSLFVSQAFQSLCAHADTECEGGRLPVPVRFMLDDFANLNLPGIDDVLSVVRSREVSCTLICQTVSQLEARYGEPAANSIIGNCDRQLVLGFQDERTARYFSLRANRTPSTLLETPAGSWWYFERGRRGACERSYDLERHPSYAELVAASEAAGADGTSGTAHASVKRAKDPSVPVFDPISDLYYDFTEEDELWMEGLLDEPPLPLPSSMSDAA